MLPSAPLVRTIVSGGAGCTKCSAIQSTAITTRTNGPSVSARSRHEICEILRRGMSRLRMLATAGEGSVLEPAEQPNQWPEHQEIDERGENDRRGIVGQALRLACLEQQLGHGD